MILLGLECLAGHGLLLVGSVYGRWSVQLPACAPEDSALINVNTSHLDPADFGRWRSCTPGCSPVIRAIKFDENHAARKIYQRKWFVRRTSVSCPNVHVPFWSTNRTSTGCAVCYILLQMSQGYPIWTFFSRHVNICSPIEALSLSFLIKELRLLHVWAPYFTNFSYFIIPRGIGRRLRRNRSMLHFRTRAWVRNVCTKCIYFWCVGALPVASVAQRVLQP